MTPRVLIILFSLIFLFLGCSPQKKQKEGQLEKDLKREMESREIKSFSEAEITRMALSYGQKGVNEIKSLYRKRLINFVNRKQWEKAIQSCNLENYKQVDSLENASAGTLTRVSLSPMNPKNRPDSLEKLVLEAYKYNKQEGIGLRPNIQPLDSGYYLYNEPVIPDQEACLPCHGINSEGNNPGLFKKLENEYPGKGGKGFHQDSVYGIWSFKFSRKSVLQSR